MNAIALALALLAAASDALPPPGGHRRLADQLDLSRLEEAAGEGRLGAGISFKLDGSHKMSLAGEKSRLATAVARRMDCGEATRLFRDAGKHEAAQKAAGLDLWYAVRCAAADGDETKEAKSQKTLKRLRRFLDSESHDGVAFIEPELEKTLTREDILPGFLAEQDERRLQQRYQYRLIKANHECNSDDAWLGSFGTVKGCADECLQTEGCRFFIYGKIGTQGDKAGWCYHEKTSDATCSKDWESDSYDFYALELMPNPDPYYAAQKPTYDLIRLPRAWEAANLDLLKDVVVNVVDSGIDLSHEDLKDAIWKNPGETCGNGLDDDTSGTSMAAPIVAGVFALGYSVNPSLSREHLLRCMKDTAINLDAENAGKSALGHQVKGGYAEKLSAGLIDARAFVECASQCFSDPGVPVAGCECHDTCATCGFSDSPTGDSDCITCKNGDPVNKQNGDATGTCDRSGPPSCFVRHPTMPDAAWKCESRCEGHKAPWREKCAWTSNDCAGCFECEWSRHAFWLTPGLPIHCKCHDTCATCGFNPEPTPTGDSDCITCKNGGPVTKVWDDGTGRCAQSSQGGKKNRRATPIVIIVICCAAVVVVVAVLFGWNRRAVALKQLHRDSSLPMPEGDVEVSAD